jgi:flagellar protein FlaG
METGQATFSADVSVNRSFQDSKANSVANEQLENSSSEPTQTLSQASTKVADNSDNRVSIDSADLEIAISEVSQFVQSQTRNLSFSIDEDSNRSVVRVTESESGEVIRQIPSEEVLRLADRINSLHSDIGIAVGILFNNLA